MHSSPHAIAWVQFDRDTRHDAEVVGAASLQGSQEVGAGLLVGGDQSTVIQDDVGGDDEKCEGLL